MIRFLGTLFIILTFSFTTSHTTACSMYKVTVNGATMVGCNHDTWLETPHIWFETKGYGTAFTGARYDGANGIAPQSGMNEFGLVFSRLAAATPKNKIVGANKKQIDNPTQYLKDILHSCKTVAEVKTYIQHYDHSTFSQDVFIYIDRSGNYLIVEPYLLTEGKEDSYVLANFCPSEIVDFTAITQQRYKNGKAILTTKSDTSLAFCTALSDTMSVCRASHGDGTLLTSIWDNTKGNVYLYFYHDYGHQVQYNLAYELAQGNHSIDIVKRFPPNKEFKQLQAYKTPLNSTAIDLALRLWCGLFLLSSVCWGISFVVKKHTQPYRYLKLGLALFNLIMAYYVFVLSTDVGIYYFKAPYESAHSLLFNAEGYIAFVLPAVVVALLIVLVKIIQQKAWGVFNIGVLLLNTLSYCALMVLAYYWGLYNVLGN